MFFFIHDKYHKYIALLFLLLRHKLGKMSKSLIQKYNVPGPRYTSYPTVPYWDESLFEIDSWKETLVKSFIESNASEGISLYIHLPFCENLCTFCGCHKKITKRHELEHPYIQAVLMEWQLYCELLPKKPIIKEIHLGGGTPTFFSPSNLENLVLGILKNAEVSSKHEFSFEGHPNNTTKAHLRKLYELGFRRVSFGIQDYSPTVQKAINRIQPFHNVAKVTFWAKEIGYESIGHDLIFGLPFQKLDDVIDTINKTNSLQPDRLAFYSYAHVPWLKGNGQRGFQDEDLPKDDEKRKLYEEGKLNLIKNGYLEIGMDHFALTSDQMYKSFENKTLHRNFMGYTASKTQVMIGLGVSSISDSFYGFAQNEKNLDLYYKKLENNDLPIFRGHLLTSEDQIIRKHILDLMCQFKTEWQDHSPIMYAMENIKDKLSEMQEDGLIVIGKNKILVTEIGKPFIRNVCMAFDLRMNQKLPETRLFSMTV